MYLKSLLLENVGPIERLDIELPFASELPQPLVLVGPNGSGKSTMVSFIINALIGLKQQVYEDTEVEQGKVFRIRTQRFIRSGSNWYHANLKFEEGLSLEEWILDRPKEQFEKEVNPSSTVLDLPFVDVQWSQAIMLFPVVKASEFVALQTLFAFGGEA